MKGMLSDKEEVVGALKNHESEKKRTRFRPCRMQWHAPSRHFRRSTSLLPALFVSFNLFLVRLRSRVLLRKKKLSL